MFIVSLLVAISAVIYSFFQWRYKHWRLRGLPYMKPHMPFGNFENLLKMKTSNGGQFQKFYEHFRRLGHVHGGVFVIANPVYVPVDLELIKDILTKDFHHFVEKDFYVNERDQPISAHLFAIGGEKWRRLRQKVTPTFTSGKMKMMLRALVECTHPLRAHLSECVANETPVDIKEAGGKLTTDIIGSVAFGIECNSFTNPDAEFRKYGRRIFEASFCGIIKGLLQFSFKELSRKLRLLAIPKDISDFFTNAVVNTIKHREETGIGRNDFLELLRNIKDASDGLEGAEKITMDEVVALAFVFFIAGFETSSTTMNFCLFELALHQDIQDKVREEINTVLDKHGGDITYQSLGELTYMKQVIDETLRKYPPIPTIDRKCTKDYKVPNTEFTLEAGTTVVIPAMGLHRDPEYFPDPENFNPGRFSEANIDSVRPFSYLPFGEGPRLCLGLRFGLMQTKVGLITLLKDFRYTLNERTSPQLEFTPSFVLSAKGDILLDVAVARGAFP